MLPLLGRNETPLNYPDALAYWYAHVNYEVRSPGMADLKLDRMRALLRLLGGPDRRLRIVHVAGSKGKGSTSAMLATILQRAGYRTGLFTSPHLVQVEERFQVNGRPISPEELATLLSEIKDVLDRGGEDRIGGRPTFFELATAIGFLHFVHRRVDAAVVEVGLGGRLDSTNVCLPALSVITSISHDHTQLLGEQLAAIAREKAGIVKPGRPVVCGVTVPDAREAIAAICAARRAPLYQLDRDFHYRYRAGRVTDEGLERPRVQVLLGPGKPEWPWLELNLLGEHQAVNAAVALACVDQLRRLGWRIPDTVVAEGLREVDWPARLEVVGRRPFVVLDCAHNVASALALVETLQTSFPHRGRRFLLFAASADKDIPGMFRVLAPHFDRFYLTRYQTSQRGVPPETLRDWLTELGGEGEVHATPALAWEAAREAAGPDDLICIAGSVFLAGDLRPLLIGQGGPSGGL